MSMMDLSRASLVAAALALGACSTTPSGPVAPTTVGSPQTAVVLTPDLQEVLSVPDVPAAQLYSWTDDGLLRYQVQLQNKTDQHFFVRVQPTFYDDQGLAVDTQLPVRYPVDKFEIKTIPVVCANKLGRKVRVQVTVAQ